MKAKLGGNMIRFVVLEDHSGYCMDGGLERGNGGGWETSEESIVFIQVREKMVAGLVQWH